LDAPVSADTVRGVLGQGEAIAQILVGRDGSFGFFADASGITGYPINLTARQVEQRVAELRYPFESQETIPPFPVDRSHALFRDLFAPVADRLRGKEHLIVVPTDDLLSLPFGLLVVEPPPPVSGFDYSRVPWMASRQALTLTPSIQSLVNLRKTVQPSRASAVFVGFGDFVPSGDPGGLMAALGMPASCRSQADAVAYAPRLPETVQELRDVSQVLGGSGNLVLGGRFSEPTLRGMPLEKYRIVSFATHGLLPSKLQCLPEPALLVSKSSAGGASGDGLLTSSEVLGIKMDADLVVLSACDTGGPEGATGGEALSGLARAFFYAGARTLMVTHWEIPSAFATQLISDTFRRAASGNITVAQALRDAQAAMIAQPLSHPKAWAGFTLVGDGAQRLTRARVASLPPPAGVESAAR
jgi:CHAT domain-containing protein